MNTTKLYPTIEEVQKSLEKFGIFDYLIFSVMLTACSCIGLFYGLRNRRRQKDMMAEYLVGNRNMPLLPISLSLFASLASAVVFLGNATEAFLFGAPSMFLSFGVVISALVTGVFFLPVYADMKLSSAYEYLGKRFDRKVRLLGALLYVMGNVAYLPVVIYIPALGVNQVTNANVTFVASIVCVICVFYTAVGGFKAVVWTDALQAVMMFMAVLMVGIKGTWDLGGFGVVWDKGMEGGRLDAPSLDLDLTTRYSLWSVSLGAGAFFLSATGVNPNNIQRYMALPSLSQAKWSLVIFVVTLVSFYTAIGYAGLVAYARYGDCDPFTTKLIKAKDQLLPLLVMDSLGNYPGLPGLFIAGVFSAALSTMSTILNAMSVVILEDLVKPFSRNELSPRLSTIIMKSTALITGAVCLGMTFLVANLGTVSQLTVSLMSVTNGPMLAMFCGGFFIPWVNAKGTFFGALIGLVINATVIFGAQNVAASGKIMALIKPTSIDNCHYIFNTTATPTVPLQTNYVFPLFKMSFMFHTTFGAAITLLLILIISYGTGWNDVDSLNPMYVSPAIRKYLPQKKAAREDESKSICDDKMIELQHLFTGQRRDLNIGKAVKYPVVYEK